MILISHRGNRHGPEPEWENNPLHISYAITEGFHVEVDVWYENNELKLGHDKGVYPIDISFLINEKIWCHAKTIETFEHLLKNSFIHCFFHQEDDCALTSRGFIWTYPGQDLTKRSIEVLPEYGLSDYVSLHDYVEIYASYYDVAGICSDYIGLFKK